MSLENHPGLKTLESFNSNEFANWLQNGLRDIDIIERRIDAFRPFHYFIRSAGDGDITGNLKKIYDSLKDNSKSGFHEGIRTAFSQLKGQPDGIDLGTKLLHLTGRIGSPESLPEIIKQFEKRTFENFEPKKQKEIFACILNITCGMSRYQEARYNTIPDLIRTLKKNPQFESNYSPMVFIALSRAEPDTFYNHLAFLRRDFANLNNDKGTKDIQITGHRFIHYVGLERLFSSFEELSFCPSNSDQILNYDNWLIHAVFRVPELKMNKEGSTLKVSYQKDSKPQEYMLTGERVTQLDNILNRQL